MNSKEENNLLNMLNYDLLETILNHIQYHWDKIAFLNAIGNYDLYFDLYRKTERGIYELLEKNKIHKNIYLYKLSENEILEFFDKNKVMPFPENFMFLSGYLPLFTLTDMIREDLTCKSLEASETLKKINALTYEYLKD